MTRDTVTHLILDITSMNVGFKVLGTITADIYLVGSVNEHITDDPRLIRSNNTSTAVTNAIKMFVAMRAYVTLTLEYYGRFFV